MKIVYITQRVQVLKEIHERRDCVDQAWSRIFVEFGCLPILLPNVLSAVKLLLDYIMPSGILFTGGNTLGSLDGDTEERDEIEFFLIHYAMENNIPLLGVCHGFQQIQDFFGGKLISISNHISITHAVEFSDETREVNSYHNYGIEHLAEGLTPIAISCCDQTIEAAKHNKYKIWGIMWHPERNISISLEDATLIKHIFGV